jgi:hypothetical protein
VPLDRDRHERAVVDLDDVAGEAIRRRVGFESAVGVLGRRAEILREPVLGRPHVLPLGLSGQLAGLRSPQLAREVKPQDGCRLRGYL